jgi:signal transduction histidine kinase
MRFATNRMSLPFRFTMGIVLVFLAALLVFYLVMRPQVADLRLMALFLSITSVITLLIGYFAYRLGWMSRAPSLRWALFGTYTLSSIVTFINVWLTARLMFVSQHDLLLGTILLLFASGIAMILGYFFSETLSHRLMILHKTTSDIRQGGLGARVEIEGNDEIAELGEAFNAMLAQLERAESRQKELDALRRDLIAWVSHDLQTPLASIRAIVEALADGMVEDSAIRQRYLATAKRDIQSLSHLIDDLFELAQLDAGGLMLDLHPNSLSDLISDTLESFSALAKERDITIDGEVENGIGLVVLDVERIGRVLTNLLGNAMRHTPRGGKVWITANRSARGVSMVVADNGEGLNPDDLPHLFDRFYRGEKSRSRATGGVGLGLAIAKGFVEAHGGHITAELVPEGGSRFVITLPEVKAMPLT